MAQKTKLLIAENVVTGTVHEAATRAFTSHGECQVKVVHTSPHDSGHGCIRRCRGWIGP